MNFLKGFSLAMLISLTAGAPLMVADRTWEWRDFIPFIWCTVIFALALGALCSPIFRMPPKRALLIRILTACAFGLISGFLWAFLSGPDVHVRFDLRLCWIGASTGVTFIAYSSKNRSLEWMVMVALCAAALTMAGVYGCCYDLYTAG